VSIGYEVDRLKRLTYGLSAGTASGDGDEATFTSRWTDILGEILPGLTTSAPAVDGYRDTGFLAYHFVHNQDDELNFRFQTSHAWDTTTPLRVHVHWIPCVNPGATQYVIWEARYAWANYGVEVGALANGWTTVEVRASVSTTDAFKPTITSLFEVQPTADCRESSFLLLRLRRLGAATPATPGYTDTYTTSKGYGTASANVLLLGCDAHYQVEKTGTINEIPT
jgi:hypothetical protein